MSIRSILGLEECTEIFFSFEGMKVSRNPKAYTKDSEDQLWVEHEGKRCKLKSTIQAYTGPIPYRKSGRS